MPLPIHLIGKLRHEYSNAIDQPGAIRSAITLAGLYSGAIGPRLATPWDVVAKIQWLCKAIELGSHSAVSAVMMDTAALQCVEEFGHAILAFRHGDFASPTIDVPALRRRLRTFAEMPDEYALNLCVFLGGTLDWDMIRDLVRPSSPTQEAEDSSVSPSSDVQSMDIAMNDSFRLNGGDAPDNVRRLQHFGDAAIDADANTGVSMTTRDKDAPFDDFESLRQLAKFTPNRNADLEVTDSDAYDLHIIRAEPLSRSNFYNQLEVFMRLAEAAGMKHRDSDAQKQMAEAILHGSIDIVRYLVLHYSVLPNDDRDDMSHFNHAVVFRRTAIVEFFLDQGATIEPAYAKRPSALHLVSRHNEPRLVSILCEHLKAEGTLSSVLESSTTAGKMAGWTAAYTAMTCQTWQNLEILLEYGADPNCATPENDISSMLVDAVIPKSPAVPRSVLNLLLVKGANSTAGSTYESSPFRWAVGSSNANAVFDLLLAGVVIPDAVIEDAEDDLRENEQMDRNGEACPVVDEDGRQRHEGWSDMLTAARLIKDLLHIAHSAQRSADASSKLGVANESSDWRDRLAKEMAAAGSGCKSKMWIGSDKAASYLLEVDIPDTA